MDNGRCLSAVRYPCKMMGRQALTIKVITRKGKVWKKNCIKIRFVLVERTFVFGRE